MQGITIQDDGIVLPKAFALALALALADEGHDPALIFGPIGIDIQSLNDEHSRISSRMLDLAWSRATETTHDKLFGIKVANKLHPGFHGILSYALYASETIEEAWQRWEIYNRAISMTMIVKLRTVGRNLVFTSRPMQKTVRPERLVTQAAIALKLARDLHRTPLSTSFATLPPLFSQDQTASEGELESLRNHFGCDVTFKDGMSEIAIPLSIARAPLPVANSRLGQHFDSMALTHVAAYKANFRENIARIIVNSLPDLPTLEAVSQEMGFYSPRAFQRRLRDEGTTFRELIAQARRDVTENYLIHSNQPLKEVAYRAGFSDQSNFTRACREWFGTPPKVVRERSQVVSASR